MLDFGWFEIRSDIFVLTICVVSLLLQTLLCFKVRRTWPRLIPAGLFFCLAAGFTLAAHFMDGWDRFGMFILALCAALPLAACGLGWGIWWLIRRRKLDTDKK